MRLTSFASLAALALGIAALPGCMTGSGGLAQPFAGMTGAPITIFRLQNFEPQPTAQPPNALGIQIPPQIQQWIETGAKMLPPGLIPPGLIPGSAPAAAADNAQRFHGFRVLGWMALNDPRQHGEVLDILGQEQNFVPQHSACMFAEFGVSIAQPNGQPAAPPPWPYPESGLPPETAKRVVAVVQRTFGGG
jgi:hypothetical protein